MNRRPGPQGERFPRGLRIALAVSGALHVVALTALAVAPKPAAMEMPPLRGVLVSPSDIPGLDSSGVSSSRAEAAKPAPPVARESEPEPARTEPVKPPEPSKPLPEAKAVPEEKPVVPPKPPEKKEPEKPAPPKPQVAKAEKKELPPKPDKPDDKKKLDEAKKVAEKESTAKRPPDKVASPTDAEVASVENRLRELAAKAERAGVPTGFDVGVPGGKGSALTDPCQAALAAYAAQVKEKVRASVAYPDQVGALTARFRLQIARDGTLMNQWVETASGNQLFDDSVAAALKKAAPFPPLPGCWRDSSVMGILGFGRDEGAG